MSLVGDLATGTVYDYKACGVWEKSGMISFSLYYCKGCNPEKSHDMIIYDTFKTFRKVGLVHHEHQCSVPSTEADAPLAPAGQRLAVSRSGGGTADSHVAHYG